jgi:hypothetical protein
MKTLALRSTPYVVWQVHVVVTGIGLTPHATVAIATAVVTVMAAVALIGMLAATGTGGAAMNVAMEAVTSAAMEEVMEVAMAGE